MILIPEIETVLILVPRTGSGSLKRAVRAQYPRAMEIYRHMEADGVPFGYDRWTRVGVVRHPVDRLWSMYKFLGTKDFGHAEQNAVARRSVARPFEDWLLHNEVPFMGAGIHTSQLGRWPQYTVRWIIPENRKSQFVYLRPDLGTQVWTFDDLGGLAHELGVALPAVANATTNTPPPPLSDAAREHVRKFFRWDLLASGAE